MRNLLTISLLLIAGAISAQKNYMYVQPTGSIVDNSKEPIITPANLAKYHWNGFKSFVSNSSDSITEGTINLFSTPARIRTAISVTGSGGSYDNTTGVITLTSGVTSITGTTNRITVTGTTTPTLDIGSDVATLSGIQTFTGVKTFTPSSFFTNSLTIGDTLYTRRLSSSDNIFRLSSASQTIRNDTAGASTQGGTFTFQAGAAGTGTDINGGRVDINAGQGRGTGTSNINLSVYRALTTGSTQQSTLDNKIKILSLGPQVLRAETAVIAALAQVVF